MTQIILASQSPRRKELLEILGISFIQRPADTCEEILPDENPVQAVQRLARQKAAAVARDCSEGIIIAADTVVVCRGKILGKPVDDADAYNMLSLLNGRDHQVITGLCVLDAATGQCRIESESTVVYFRRMDEEEIRAYIRSGEPADKAGAYGIQGRGSIFVEKLEGCYFNVVGLPVGRLYQMLKGLGLKLLGVRDTE